MNIELLKEDVISRHGSYSSLVNPFYRNIALWQARSETKSSVEMRARMLLKVAEVTPVELRTGWTLAGEHLICREQMFGSDEKQNDFENLARQLGLRVEFDEVQAVLQEITDRGSALNTPRDKFNEGAYCGWNFTGTDKVFSGRGWIENHSIRDYSTLLETGFSGLLGRIEAQSRTTPFLEAAKDVCKAGITLGKKYADLARSKGLNELSNTCERVPAYGARTFREAVQALWFGHILTCAEDGINANSIGRLDQILYPYYTADIQAGRITRENAVCLMEELACKLYLDYDVQAITLGGIDASGKCAVNELSYIILEATENIGLIRDLSIRIDHSTPQKFIDKCSQLILRGGGVPFIFNDECFIKALTDRGIELEDARDYSPIGCVELTIPGKANPHAVSGWFNALKCLELTLFNGTDHRSGKQIGPQTGELASFSSFEEFYAAYRRQVYFFADRMVYHCNEGELEQQKHGPLPCWSVLTDDCIKRGRDITDGGALYNYHSICLMGAPDTADALYAINQIIFKEKSISPEKLLEVLKNNFSGAEMLRQRLLGLPKYGNDINEVDLLAGQVCNDFISYMDKQKSPLNGRYFVHLFTFLLNIKFGKAVGAMPDGRLADTPLAYSLSAHQGRDQQGLTAMLKSLSKQPHNRAAGGSAAIIDLHPSLLSGQNGVTLLSSLIRSALATGIGQLQWNVTTVEELEKAKAEPERYGNIPVRVAGYSQMFKLLDPELQDHVIARHKHVS